MSAALREATMPDGVTRWWFAPVATDAIRWVRVALGLLSAAYFIDANRDAAFWMGDSGPHSTSRIAEFLDNADLASAVAFSISPLYLIESGWVFQAYAIIGALLGIIVTASANRVSAVVWQRTATWLLWLMLVAWANRLLWLAGVTEQSLSLMLFALAITTLPAYWGTRELGLRLMAVQTSLLAATTWMTMLSSEIWWDGTGALALAAPVPHRTLDLTTWLSVGWLDNLVSHLMMIAVPLGLLWAWHQRTAKVGVAILILWATLIAVLGSHWIHGGVLAVGFVSLLCLYPSDVCDHNHSAPANKAS